MRIFTVYSEPNTDTMLLVFSVLLLSLVAFNGINADEDLVVQLPKGKIRGHILLSENKRSYYAFQQIPYAAPPVSSNRFQLAKEPEPWSGILDATKNTKVCYQGSGQYASFNITEDCLFLNVYTPVKPGSPQRLPVIIWIHGGAFQVGSSDYNHFGPQFIIDHEVVVVTINYRLGPFGFLTTVDDVIPANIGLKDQIFALEWVQENIELFGGNKSRVTLDGGSAGSVSIGMHLTGPWPNNKVLFHAAMMHSGSELLWGKSNNARQEAFEAGKKLDKTFNSSDSKELLKVLQKASADDILKSGHAENIIDKSGPYSCQLYECLATGNFKKLPILIGFTSEERIAIGSQRNVKEQAAALDKDPSQMLGSQFNISSTNRTAAGNLLKRIYTNTSFEEDIGAFVRWHSDTDMTTPLTKQAVLQAKAADVFLYQFSYKGNLGGGMNIPAVKGAERVANFEEKFYMWDQTTNSDLSKFPAEDRVMLHRYVTLLTNFVKHHNPTPIADPLLGKVIWPKINPQQPDSIRYLNINSTMEVLENPRYFQKVNKVLDNYITYHDII